MIAEQPSNGAAEQRLDDILASYLKAAEAGQAPDRQSLLASHPEVADDLAEFFAGLDHLEQLAAPLRAVRLSSAGSYPVGSGVDTTDDARTGQDALRVAPAPAAQPAVGPIPGYEILSVLGRGGMGIVYQARQVQLKRLVALKMIRAGDLADDSERARFRTEVEAVARLHHPNIVQIYQVGEHNGQPFCALEFVSGGTLADRLAGTPQTPRQAAELVRTLALAMDVAHQRGIVHRDLKPGNVLLTTDGTPKITDFGLAKHLDEDTAQTRTGAVMGTPAYMAPEQALGQKTVGPPADVYAVGAILYEMLTGRPPFKGATALDTLDQVRSQEPAPVRTLQRQVPLDLETICLKCLEKQPGKRYTTAAELANRLGLFLDGKPIPERPPGWLSKIRRWVWAHPLLTTAAILLVVVTSVALLAAHYLDPERPRKEVQNTLERRRPYVFKGTEQLPGPFRQVYGKPAPLTRTEQAQHFSVERLATALWELTDDPRCDRYRFSAEVRHDNAGGASLVGLYFGYRKIPVAKGQQRAGFYTLSFADRGSGVTLGQVLLEARLLKVPPEDYVAFGPIDGRPFQPALPLREDGPWRKLQIVVTPEGIEAMWEKEPGALERVGFRPAKQMEKALAVLGLSILDLRDVPTDFRPRSGLGLYVSGGKASFRNVTVQPLDSGS